MKIIVTGGLGFIGSNLIHFLNKKGLNKILIVDDFNVNEKFLNVLGCKYLDIVSIDEFETGIENNKFNDFEITVHQGACSDTMETDGQYVFKNNYTFSKKLLDYSVLNNIRLIYASSAAVYGNSKVFKEIPEYENPINIYGFSKLCFDNYVRQKIINSKSQIAGLRYFNVYGPREDFKGKMSSIAYQLYNQQINKGNMSLFGKTINCEPGEQKRDFVYIRDILNFNWFLIENPNVSGVFNAGTGKANKYLDVANNVFLSMRQNKKLKKKSVNLMN